MVHRIPGCQCMEESGSLHWCKWKTEDWSWLAVFLTSRTTTTDTVTSVHRPKPPRCSYITYSRHPGTSWSKVMSRMLRPVFFLTVAFLARVQGYSGGPPASACDSMRPGPPHQVDMWNLNKAAGAWNFNFHSTCRICAIIYIYIRTVLNL